MNIAAKALASLAYKYGFREQISITVSPAPSEVSIPVETRELKSADDYDEVGVAFDDEREQPSVRMHYKITPQQEVRGMHVN